MATTKTPTAKTIAAELRKRIKTLEAGSAALNDENAKQGKIITLQAETVVRQAEKIADLKNQLAKAQQARRIGRY